MPVIHDSIRTNSTLDVYPTHEASLGKGGYRTVADIAERDNIPFERCEVGMLVTVLNDNTNNKQRTTYILNQNTRERRVWEKFNNDTNTSSLETRLTRLQTANFAISSEVAELTTKMGKLFRAFSEAELDELARWRPANTSEWSNVFRGSSTASNDIIRFNNQKSAFLAPENVRE